MIACCRVEVRLVGGRSRLVDLVSAAPLRLQPGADALYLVGSAAGPLGGDDVDLEIAVGPGASLAIRSVAAAVALRGDGTSSRLTVHAEIGNGASLSWRLQPGVSAAGSRHESVASVRLREDGRLDWREEVVLGRTGEPSGVWRSELNVSVGARPVLRHELVLCAAAMTSAAELAGGRAVGSLLVFPSPATPAGAAALSPDRGLSRSAVLRLAAGGTFVQGLAAGGHELRRVLDEAEAALGLSDHAVASAAPASGQTSRSA